MLKKFGMVASVVALLAMALVGCKNGLLGEEDATVNGRLAAGGRSVSVTITNFAGNGQQRSFLNPLRTVAPDQIDLKNNSDDYVFVATGSSGYSTLTPVIITVVGGVADLSGLDPRIWNLTITAYESNKIAGDKADPQNVVQDTGNAAVLSGSAVVDLTYSNGATNITLTPYGVGTQGSVRVTLNLHANDWQTIQPGTDWKMTVGLYDRNTGEAKQTVGQQTSVKTEDPIAAQSCDYIVDDMPTGEYTLKVELFKDGEDQPWVWGDTLYVEGNRETADTIDLPELLEKKPGDPTNFAVYYDRNSVNKHGDDYEVRFAWDRGSYNEAEFVLEVADITEYYTYEQTQMKFDGTPFTDSAGLWTQIEAKVAAGDDLVTTIGKEGSGRIDYPAIYAKQGSLLTASTYVHFRMETGKVYAARLKARNRGGESQLVHLGAAEPASKWTAAGTADPVRLDDAQFIFDAYTIVYDLKGYVLLKDGQSAAAQAPNAVKTTTVSVAYKPGQNHPIDYKAYASPGATDGYMLFPEAFAGVASELDAARLSWDKWVVKGKAGTAYTTEYDGWENVALRPNGTGTTSATLDVISSGTYAKLLTEETLLVEYSNNGTAAFDGTQKLSSKTTDISAAGVQAGLGKVGGTRYGVNVQHAAGVQNWLHFTVGAAIAGQFEEGKLLDAEGREATVSSVTYTLKASNGSEYFYVCGTPSARYDVTTIADGDYTLYVEAKTTTAYTFTFQTPFVVKDTQVAAN